MTPPVAMTLAQVRDLLGCEVYVEAGDLATTTVSAACGADLMSDVLAFTKSGALLLTGLPTAQSVRTAEVADIRAIVYVRAKRPDASAVALAQEMGLPLLGTPLLMYEACGRLFAAGLPGCAAADLAGPASTPGRPDARAQSNELHQGV